MRLFHGGVPGLGVGDLIQPGHQRQSHPGCPICEVRERGGDPLIDPASRRPDRVYLSEDREYARYYASLFGHGDLYAVEPVGELERSPEDMFPSYTAPAARVLAVYGRRIELSWSQRRSLYRRWAALDGVGARDAEHEFARMAQSVAVR